MNFGGDSSASEIETELRIGTSAYGSVLPVLYGTNRIAGNVIWMPHSLWVKEGSGTAGKGGDSTSGAHYWQGLAIAICEGPITNGLKRIWGDKEVFANLAELQSKTGSDTITFMPGTRTQAPPVFVSQPILTRYAADFTTAGFGVRTFVLNQAEAANITQVLDIMCFGTSFSGSIPPAGPVHLTKASAATPGYNEYTVTAGANPTITINVFFQGSWDGIAHVLFEYDAGPSGLSAPANLALSSVIGYGGTAYIICKKLSLGSSNSLKNYTYEVNGFLTTNTTGGPVNPADIIQDFLTNTEYGAEWPAAQLETVIGQDGTAASGYQRYCSQMGFLLSPAFDTQKPALEHVKWILDATNSTILNSGGKVKIVPLGDVTVGTYTPYTTATALNQDDFMAPTNTDPVQVIHTGDAETYNCFPVEFIEPVPVDPDSAYNASVVEEFEQGNVEATGGVRKASLTSFKCITTKSMAQTISRIMAQRSCYIRNTYKFQLGWKYCLLEPLDLITITDPVLGLVSVQARINSIDEDEQGTLTVEAEEWPFGIAHATAHATGTGDGGGQKFGLDPLISAPPAIALAPIQATADKKTPELWIAGAAGGKDWGGAQVWLSWDNATYTQVGDIHGGVYGTVGPASFTTGSPLDTSSILSVDLRTSGGTLSSVTVAERDNLASLCYVDGELLAYQTATLTATGLYDLTLLRRGVSGSPISAHVSKNSLFMLMNSNVLRVPINQNRYGQTVYIKLVSYNLARNRIQALSSASAYAVLLPTLLVPPKPGAAPIPMKLTFEEFNIDNYSLTQAGTALTTPATGLTGGNVLEITGTTQLIHKQLIPYDESRLYKLVCLYRCPQNSLILSQLFDATRTNLVFNSEQVDLWTALNATVTTNATTAPDGTPSADQISEGVVASVQHRVNTTGVTADVVGELRCWSVYVKANNLPNINIAAPGAFNSGVNFNLSTGVIDSVAGVVTSGVIKDPAAPGWYRVWFVRQGAVTGTNLFLSGCLNGTYSSSGYTGTSRSFYAWGAMCETVTDTSGPSTYISTPSAVAVTLAWTQTNVAPMQQLTPGVARTNLVTFSEDQTNVAWTKSNFTVVADTQPGPLGAPVTADKLVESVTASVEHYSDQSFTAVASSVVSLTTYVRAAGRSWVYLAVVQRDAVTVVGSWFDVNLGVKGTEGAISSTITNVGTGWYRLQVSVNVGTGGSSPRLRIKSGTADNQATYTGDGSQGIFVWGAQAELGTPATVYIPTPAGSTVTVTDVAAPDGSTTAYLLSSAAASAGLLSQSFTSLGGSYTFSVWLRNYTGSAGSILRIFDVTSATSLATTSTASVTGSWTRVSVTAACPVNDVCRVDILPNGLVSALGTVLAWSAQLDYSGVVSPNTLTTWTPRPPLLTNLALWSGDLTNTIWIKQAGITITSAAFNAPDGFTAQAVTDSTPAASLTQTIPNLPFTRVLVFSVWGKRNVTGCVGSIAIYDAFTASTLATTTVDTTAVNAWTLYTVTATVPASHDLQVVINIPVGGSIAIWHPLCNYGATAGAYVKTQGAIVDAADHNAYFGFVGYRADTTTSVTIGGVANQTSSAHYLNESQNVDGQWHTLTGYMKGRGAIGSGSGWVGSPTAPGVAEASVRYMRLLMYLNNHSNGPSFADGVVDVDNVSLTEVDESTIYSGLPLTGGQIGPGAITAFNFAATLGGGNLLDNSSFENSVSALTGWTNSGTGTFTFNAADVAIFRYGTQSFKITQTVTGVDSYYWARYLVAKPNQKYILSGWVYVDSITAGATGNRSLLIYDGTGSAADTTLAAGHATGVWTRKSIAFTSTGSATFIECRIYAPNGTVHWDGIQLEEGDVTTSYAPRTNEILPSTVGTTELVALSVTTAKIATGQIITDRLAAGAIVADKITVNELITAHGSLGGYNTRNLWPNPNSEVDPPTSYAPPNDGTDAEFDFRFNAGAGAYCGNWVRKLTRSTAGTTTLKFKVPCSFDEGLQFRIWYKWVSSGGGASAALKVKRLKADLSTFDTAVNTNLLTANTSWTSSGNDYFLVNDTNVVWAEFSIELITGSAGTAELQIDSLLASLIIVATDISLSAVTTTKILDANVTAAKLSAQESWNAFSFGTNWSNLAGAWSTAEYMKDHLGFVHLKGMVKYALTGGAATTIGTLPSGYRPATNKQRQFSTPYWSGANYLFSLVTVNPSGTVVCEIYTSTLNANGWLSLEGITFDTR